jgi:hypothetical protein
MDESFGKEEEDDDDLDATEEEVNGYHTCSPLARCPRRVLVNDVDDRATSSAAHRSRPSSRRTCSCSSSTPVRG